MQAVYFVQILEGGKQVVSTKKYVPFFFLKQDKTVKSRQLKNWKGKIGTWGQVKKARQSCAKAAVLASVNATAPAFNIKNRTVKPNRF